MISRILAEEGVPQDLIYVVQAESGFRAQAKSPKAAGGMWQFVSWRGREYGLTHKLLLPSDFPSATIDNVIAGLRAVNAPVEGTKLPQIPKEIQDRIISENWKEAFPEWL
jgi:hypothetical protein